MATEIILRHRRHRRPCGRVLGLVTEEWPRVWNDAVVEGELQPLLRSQPPPKATWSGEGRLATTIGWMRQAYTWQRVVYPCHPKRCGARVRVRMATLERLVAEARAAGSSEVYLG